MGSFRSNLGLENLAVSESDTLSNWSNSLHNLLDRGSTPGPVTIRLVASLLAHGYSHLRVECGERSPERS
ncbi:MAG: hypothetical protein UR54_C0029G0006 [Candidatus Roizmanbacteria bacterium GW2011_GWA2_34_18]|uniref:Uncharacterized protein n=1 Tax=Candidatus Roizmanbacteria bacterium GW2011_GWA2_34_18 TaxID=1618477 RepID=A0A0G0D7M9_9BACT|nr:MAG: hypothetical protein UR54_C0029G0006 [Candidatus Roizmanbacteria bacterium GW2011_GWA2_34_18]